MNLTPQETALLLFAISFAGAILPLFRRWSDRGLHMFVSISAGIFLGTIFLHLLPHLAGVEDGDGDLHAHLGAAAAPTIAPWIAALVGLLLLFAIEKVWLRSVTESAAANVHTGLWVATYLGLSLHSITEGFALTAILEHSGARTQLLLAILMHKATEAFSLATVMRLAHLKNVQALVFLLIFASMGPLGLLLGARIASTGGAFDTLLTGFACGTFLYVAVCDLLPEVFHGTDRPLVKLASVVAGILITAITLPRLQWALAFGERVGRESLAVFVEIAPYLIAGFLIAGVLSQVLKTDRLTRHLAGDDLKSVVLASLIGAPLPLCSCSVVPVAVAMRRSGASKGATTAFLIATPETGVDSVTVSWALLDPFLTIARPIGAIVSAIFVGTAVNWLVRRDQATAGVASEHAPAASDCCEHDHGAVEVRAAAQALAARAPSAQALRPARSWPRRVLHHAFVEMLDDITVSMLVGVLLSGVIAASLPAELFQSPLAHGFGGLVLMLAIGIPIYVCASASTPIAAALILKGMSPGAAFVFLLASPATNIGALFVLSRQLGKRVVIVQVVALALVTLALGALVDWMYPLLGLVPSAALGAESELVPSWVAVGSALVLGALMLASLARTHGSRDLFHKLRSAPQPAAP